MTKQNSPLNIWILVYVAIAIAMAGSYLYLTITAPTATASERFNVTAGQLILIKLSLAIPFLIYWSMGALSAINLQRYSSSLQQVEAREGRAIKKIGLGVFILVFGLILNALIGAVRSNAPQVQEILMSFTIASNYFNALIPLAAFWLIWQGTRLLVDNVKKKISSQLFIRATLVILAIAVAYIFLAFENPYRQTSDNPLINPTYYISDFWVFTTILIPYIIYWTLGIFSVINIALYSKDVSGVIYKKFFRNLTIGLSFIVGLSVALQFLSTVGYTFAEADIGLILLLIYPIVLVQALGYVFIARAAGRLKLIEDIV